MNSLHDMIVGRTLNHLLEERRTRKLLHLAACGLLHAGPSTCTPGRFAGCGNKCSAVRASSAAAGRNVQFFADSARSIISRRATTAAKALPRRLWTTAPFPPTPPPPLPPPAT